MKLRNMRNNFFHTGIYPFRNIQRKVKPPRGWRWIKGTDQLVLKRK